VLTAGPSVNQNFDIATTGGGLYYPAFAMDGAGDMYVVYNISSSTLNVGVRITGQAAGAPVQTVSPGQTIRSGDTTYDMNPCFGTNQTSRWGDYNGAAIDPQNTGDAWVVGEFAAIGSSANGDAGCDWATYVAQLTFSASTTPTLSSISPASGPAAGGTAVTFTGTGFDTAIGKTTFSFGGATATGVSCSSSTTCSGASPAGTGTVTVTATVDGTPASGSATFTYLGAPSLSSISPTTGPAGGGTTVTFTGTGFDTTPGKTTFAFGGAAATGVSCASTTTCTGASPAGVGTVTVTSTVDGAPASGSATFGYIPSLSSISPSAAPAGTRVTITGVGFDVAAGATVFKFGGATATSVVCTSSTTCTAVVPPGSGVVSVVAVVDGRQSSNSLSFRYRKK
jgi:IPT/TIG domain